MFFYETLMAASLVICLTIGIHLRRVKRHDRVLYRFCQVRRDIMTLFRDRGFEMSKHDYFALRDLLEVVNDTIHHFHECKSTIFNFRTLHRMARELRESDLAFGEIEFPKDKDALAVIERYRGAMFRAFLTYTPFIKSEIALRITLALVVAVGSFAGKIGLDSLKRLAEDFQWIQAQIGNNNHQHA